MYNYTQYPTMPEVTINPLTDLESFRLTVPQILDAPEYMIDCDGIVYQWSTGATMTRLSNRSIVLKGKTYSIDRLLLDSYVGKLPLDVVPRECVPKYHVGHRCSAYTYAITSINIDPHDENVIYINDKVRFKQVPYTIGNIYVSENGVVFDLDTREFLLKIFINGYASMSIPYDHKTMLEYSPDRISYKALMPVYRMVYSTYKGILNSGIRIYHTNQIKADDHVSNLQPVSFSNNTRYLNTNDYRNQNTPHTQNEIVAKLISEGKSNYEIATAIGYGYETRQEKHRIASLVNRIKNVPGYCDDLKRKYNLQAAVVKNPYPFKRLTPEERIEIKRESKTMSGKELVKKYGVSKSAISKIIHDESIVVD